MVSYNISHRQICTNILKYSYISLLCCLIHFICCTHCISNTYTANYTYHRSYQQKTKCVTDLVWGESYCSSYYLPQSCHVPFHVFYITWLQRACTGQRMAALTIIYMHIFPLYIYFMTFIHIISIQRYTITFTCLHCT